MTPADLITNALHTPDLDPKYLYKEDSWYLVDKKELPDIKPTECISIIVHICPKSWKVKTIPDERGVEQIEVHAWRRYFFKDEAMNTRCLNCGEHPPEGIVGLWRLHNWESLVNLS